ncbi:MAG: alpha/beta fold hydrolase [Myxococcales bacterium]|nr:MAG: alpha/beta fold hydrolase [Myxococcales bacterium]
MEPREIESPWAHRVQIRHGLDVLEGSLTVPTGACGVVLFAHGSRSSRHSPRNRLVASVLNEARFATLLLDLQTAEEGRREEPPAASLDIVLRAERLMAATDWLAHEPLTARLPVGYFGASTGTGAALVAAARRPDRVQAVVSRGGHPELATEALPRVRAPTLLIVGEQDTTACELHRLALCQMRVDAQLAVVVGATCRFEEPGALRVVARLARDWFRRILWSA